MTARSAKAKGRVVQDSVAKSLREKIYLPLGLEEDDCKPITMGLPGADIILTPAARKVFNPIIECKNVESLNVVKTYWDHYAKYQDAPGLKLLIHKKNRTDLLATIRWQDLLALLEELHVTRAIRKDT